MCVGAAALAVVFFLMIGGVYSTVRSTDGKRSALQASIDETQRQIQQLGSLSNVRQAELVRVAPEMNFVLLYSFVQDIVKILPDSKIGSYSAKFLPAGLQMSCTLRGKGMLGSVKAAVDLLSASPARSYGAVSVTEKGNTIVLEAIHP